MRRMFRRRTGLALVLLVVGVGAAPAWGVDTDDIVRLHRAGYSEQSLIELIVATRSVFHLEVEDLVGLKRRGIGEAVISFMLMTPERFGTPPARETAARPRDRAPGRVGDHPIFGIRIEWVPDEAEEDQLQAIVTLAGVGLLAFQPQATAPDPLARARAVVTALELAAAMSAPDLEVLWERGAARLRLRTHAGPPGEPFLTVLPGDAAAFTRRSRGPVSVAALVEWWIALLEDGFRLLAGVPPAVVVHTPDGRALPALRRRATILARGNTPGPDHLRRSVPLLDGEDQERLARLALVVPVEFSRRRVHLHGN